MLSTLCGLILLACAPSYAMLLLAAAFVGLGSAIFPPESSRIAWLAALLAIVLLPHADLFWTTTIALVIGLVLSSAFSAMLVYAQELMPGKVGMLSGLFFGFAFGMGGLGAAVLGLLADHAGIAIVCEAIAYLPLLVIAAAPLPKGRAALLTKR